VISGASRVGDEHGCTAGLLYLRGRKLDIHRFRGTLLSFFLSASIVTLALFTFIWRVCSDVLTVGAADVPAIVAGVIILGAG
jgi:hypothetical protein